MTNELAGLVLAAGRGSRFRAAGGAMPSKLTALLDGEPLVRHAAQAALGAGLTPVIVVTGHARADVEAALSGLAVTFVHNADFASGLASSLRAGVAAAPAECAGLIVLLGDMPRVSAALVAALAARFTAAPEAAAVAPVHGGVRGNPVVIARALFPRIATLAGDEGARKLLAGLGAAVIEHPVDDAGVTADVDTPAALAALSAQ